MSIEEENLRGKFCVGNESSDSEQDRQQGEEIEEPADLPTKLKRFLKKLEMPHNPPFIEKNCELPLNNEIKKLMKTIKRKLKKFFKEHRNKKIDMNSLIDDLKEHNNIDGWSEMKINQLKFEITNRLWGKPFNSFSRSAKK